MARPTRAGVFRSIGALNPERSAHDLSHRKLTTDDMGRLIPITNFLAIPGDTFTISNQVIVRLQPTYAPVLHEINAFVHWFFVPYRILLSQWENYITGGRTGNYTFALPRIRATISDAKLAEHPDWLDSRKGGLLDYLYGLSLVDNPGVDKDLTPERGNSPTAFKLYAYNKIYNEYYRDENFIDEVPLYDREFKLRAWEKDFATSAQPNQQRGLAPAMPLSADPNLSGLLFTGALDQPLGLAGGVDFSNTNSLAINMQDPVPAQWAQDGSNFGTGTGVDMTSAFRSKLTPNNISAVTASPSFINWLQQNRINVGSIATFDISDLRNAVQLQKYLERNQRAGARYTEWLRSRFGVSPNDERLDRPEYIGGSKSPVMISEVLQTSESSVNSPQANMAGHGIAADRQFIGKYKVYEYGVIMAILSVMPRSMYANTFLKKEDNQLTKYEFPIPEFTHVSERAVTTSEIYISAKNPDTDYSNNTRIFGYVGMYDEYRYLPSMAHNDMRNTLDYWHLGRKFSSLPYLNRSFIECNPQATKRIFNVQIGTSLIIAFGANIKAVRPLPFLAEPGLVDHF